MKCAPSTESIIHTQRRVPVPAKPGQPGDRLLQQDLQLEPGKWSATAVVVDETR